MSSDGFNQPFDTGLKYDSTNPTQSQGFGDGWLPGSLAGLGGAGSGGMVTYETAPGRTLAFLPDSGGYKSAYFIKEQLSQDSGTGDYGLLGTRGDRSAFSSSGQRLATTSPGGQATQFSYDGSGHIETVVTTSGGVSVEYVYAWSSNRVSSITYKVAGREVLRTTFGYDGTKLATVKTWENSTPGAGAATGQHAGRAR